MWYMTAQGRGEQKNRRGVKQEHLIKVRCAARAPWQDVTLCLMNQQYKTISSSHNVIGRRKSARIINHVTPCDWPSACLIIAHLTPWSFTNKQATHMFQVAECNDSTSGEKEVLLLRSPTFPKIVTVPIVYIIIRTYIRWPQGQNKSLSQIFVQSKLLQWICCHIAEAWLMRCRACLNTKQQAVVKSFWKSATPSFIVRNYIFFLNRKNVLL